MTHQHGDVVIVYHEEFAYDLPNLQTILREELTQLPLALPADAQVQTMVRADVTAERLRHAGLVVAYGGDGTLLSVSHYVRRTPVLHVHSSGPGSVGHFAAADLRGLRPALRAGMVLASVPRLAASITSSTGHSSSVDLALNEYYIGNRVPWHATKLRISADGGPPVPVTSSGLLACTLAGYSGWASHVTHLPLSEFLQRHGGGLGRFCYVLREPMEESPPLSGLASVLEIEAVGGFGSVVPDAYDEFTYKRHDRIRIEVATDSPLQLVRPKGVAPLSASL